MLYDNGPRMPRIPAVPNRMPYQPPQGMPQRPPGVADPFGGGDNYLKQRYASPRGLGGTMPSPNQQPAPVYGRPPASIGGWGQSPWQQQGYQQPSQGPQWLRRQGAAKRRPMYGMGYGGMQTIGEMQQPFQQRPYQNPMDMQVGLPPGFRNYMQ